MRDRLMAALSPYHLQVLVPDYTFMLTSALILGAIMTVRRARRHGLSAEDAYQAVFYTLLAAFPGARVVYALQYWHQFSQHPLELVNPSRGGLALYGGLLGMLLGPALYLGTRRVSLGRYFDATAPAFAFGLFLGRTGCFLAGCNWGRSTDLPWAVCFPPPHHAYAQHLKAGLIAPGAPLSLPVHPTQLYEALFGLLMFGSTVWWLKKEYPAKEQPWSPTVPGKVFLWAMSAYAVFRFSVEFVRADAQGLQAGPLTVAQAISLAVLGASQITFWIRRGLSAADRPR